jgi:hypothetical protein
VRSLTGVFVRDCACLQIEILVANNKEEMDLGRNKFHEAVGSLKAYHESVMKAMAAASAPTLASH